MAIWPFNRRNKKEDVPTEIKEYYQAERRERVGFAWLLALGTFLVTVGVVTGLFFAGRWAYREIANDEPSTTVSENQPQQLPGAPQDQQSPQQEQAQPDSDQGTGQTTPPQNGTPAPSTPTPSPTPQVETDSELPNTGPGNILTVFLLVSVTGAAAHYGLSRLVQVRRNG